MQPTELKDQIAKEHGLPGSKFIRVWNIVQRQNATTRPDGTFEHDNVVRFSHSCFFCVIFPNANYRIRPSSSSPRRPRTRLALTFMCSSPSKAQYVAPSFFFFQTSEELTPLPLCPLAGPVKPQHGLPSPHKGPHSSVFQDV